MRDISLLGKHCDGWRQARSGPIKTWTDKVRKDFECIDEPAIYGFRKMGNEERMTFIAVALTMALDRIAWKQSQRSQSNQLLKEEESNSVIFH